MEDRTDFPPTSWTLVASAKGDGGGKSLEKLVSRYVPALQNFLISALRVDPHDAEEIVQEFVASKIIERQLLEAAEPSRGRLRSFLSASLRNFLVDRQRQDISRRRTELRASQLHDESFVKCDSTSFDIEWARAILEQTASALRHHFETSDRKQTWQVFELRVVRPLQDGTPPPSYATMVKQLGFRSATEACSAVTTAKRAFARILHEVISQTIGEEADLDDEIRHLRQILSASRSIGD